MAVSDVITRLAVSGGPAYRQEMQQAATATRQMGAAGTQAAGGLSTVDRAAAATQQSARQVAQSVQGVGDRMSLFVSLPIAAALYASAQAASSLNEAVAFSDSVFKQASGSVQDWAAGMLDSFGVARVTAVDAANSFGIMFGNIGATEDQAAGLSERLVELAVDMSSAKDVPLNESLTALRAALIGETEPIRRFIGSMSEAEIQSFAVAKGIAEQGKELTDAQKIQARYAFILERTAVFQGDYARTADSAANSQRRAGQAVMDSAAELGDALAPALAKGADAVTFFAGAFAALPEGMQTAIVGLGLVAFAAGPVISILGRIMAFRLGQTSIQSVDALRVAVEGLAVAQGAEAASTTAVAAATSTAAAARAEAALATGAIVVSEEALAAASGNVQLQMFGATTAIQAEGAAATAAQGQLFSMATAEEIAAAEAAALGTATSAAAGGMAIEGAAAAASATGFRTRAAAMIGSLFTTQGLTAAISSFAKVAGVVGIAGGLIEALRHITGQAHAARDAMEQLTTERTDTVLVETFEKRVENITTQRRLGRGGIGNFIETFLDPQGGDEQTEARLGVFRDLAEQNTAAARRLRNAIADTGGDTADFDRILKDVIGSQKQHASDARENANIIDDLGGSMEGAAVDAETLKKHMDGLASAQRDSTSAQRDLESSARDIAEAERAVVQHTRDVESARRDVAQTSKGIADAERGVAEAHRRVSEAERAAAQDAIELARARKDLEDADLAVVEAERRLDEARARVPRDLAEAELDLREAALAVTEAEEGLLGSATDPRWEELASDHPAARAAREAAKVLEEQRGQEEDAAKSTTDAARAQISFERAILRRADAQERYNELVAAGNRPRGVVEAEEAVADAIERRADAQTRIDDLAARDPSQRIVEARRGVRDAEDQVRDAVQRHQDARIKLNDLLAQDPYVRLREAQARNLELLAEEAQSIYKLKDAFAELGITGGPIIDGLNARLEELRRRSAIEVAIKLGWDPAQVTTIMNEIRQDVAKNIAPPPTNAVIATPTPGRFRQVGGADVPPGILTRETIIAGERQTGGELYLPRLGIPQDRAQALLDVGARWYGLRMVPEDTKERANDRDRMRFALAMAEGGVVTPGDAGTALRYMAVALDDFQHTGPAGAAEFADRIHTSLTVINQQAAGDTATAAMEQALGRYLQNNEGVGPNAGQQLAMTIAVHLGRLTRLAEIIHTDDDTHVTGWTDATGTKRWARTTVPPEMQLDTFPPEPGEKVVLEGVRHVSMWRDRTGRLHIGPSWLPNEHEADTWPATPEGPPPEVLHRDSEAQISGWQGDDGIVRWARTTIPSENQRDTFPPTPGQPVELTGRREVVAWRDEEGRVHIGPSWLPPDREADTWPVEFAASGFIGTVTRPTVLVVGEGGRAEDVVVVPRDGSLAPTVRSAAQGVFGGPIPPQGFTGTSGRRVGAPPGVDMVGGPLAVALRAALPAVSQNVVHDGRTREWNLTVQQSYTREPRDLDFARAMRLGQNLMGADATLDEGS